MTQPSPAEQLRTAVKALTAPAGTPTVTIPATAAHALGAWLTSWARDGLHENHPWPDLHHALTIARAITGDTT